MRVYVSAPTDAGLTPWQKKFKKGVLDQLIAAGLEPQLFGERGLPIKTSWSFDAAEEMMSQCHAAVVLALARHRFSVHDAAPVNFPSEYNHYEGALAIAHKLPLLILAEEGLPDRGITYRGGGRFIITVPANAKATWFKSKGFKPYFEEWRKSIDARRDIFVGYCSTAQSVADAIIKHLNNTLKVSVMDWAVDFDPGPSILQNIEDSVEKTHAGIFLFTEDDPLSGSSTKAAPRDNVVFEAGYFMRSKGPSRVLIVRENEAKMPADLGGTIYAALPDRKNIAALHEPLRKFIKAALRR